MASYPDVKVYTASMGDHEAGISVEVNAGSMEDAEFLVRRLMSAELAIGGHVKVRAYQIGDVVPSNFNKARFGLVITAATVSWHRARYLFDLSHEKYNDRFSLAIRMCN